MPKKLDLNCDMGENPQSWFEGEDKQLLDCINSINISCGFHAGDPVLIKDTLRLAAEKKLRIGAHPGFDDRANFGRKAWPLTPDTLFDLLKKQLTPFVRWAEEAGATLHHIKAHGALYNMLSVNDELAEAYCRFVQSAYPNWIVYCLPKSSTAKWAERLGLQYWSEAFADRSYQSNGQLTARNLPNALLTTPETAIEQVRQIAEKGTLRTVDGEEIEMNADTVCVHGDGQYALAIARGLKSSGLFE
ncbi:LamB/YcsF family protein [Marinilongibacter aquaticus]|uniref:5-oxoprolinase subunit PxpA n=1 Tax=Marinilongibacter aquaticus TaxID=2975157 RepID=UPI0021BDD4AE|nr:5-oxoprolinase subunit PxpA [Marinilongibacter aquaticus]UBM58483.1 LamB/YcsF family protein [Marinilongibacter aquaticus]